MWMPYMPYKFNFYSINTFGDTCTVIILYPLRTPPPSPWTRKANSRLNRRVKGLVLRKTYEYPYFKKIPQCRSPLLRVLLFPHHAVGRTTGAQLNYESTDMPVRTRNHILVIIHSVIVKKWCVIICSSYINVCYLQLKLSTLFYQKNKAYNTFHWFIVFKFNQ